MCLIADVPELGAYRARPPCAAAEFAAICTGFAPDMFRAGCDIEAFAAERASGTRGQTGLGRAGHTRMGRWHNRRHVDPFAQKECRAIRVPQTPPGVDE